MAANVTISFFWNCLEHILPRLQFTFHMKKEFHSILQYPSFHSIAWYCIVMDIITWNYILLKFTSHMKKAPGVSLGHLPNGASLALSL